MNEPSTPGDVNPPQPECSCIRSIPSEELLQGARQILIIHHGETYRLMVTRNDKLLLQK